MEKLMAIKAAVKQRVSSFARNTEHTLLLMLIFIVDINIKYVTKSWILIESLAYYVDVTAATMNRSPNKRFHCRTMVAHVCTKS